MSLEDSESRRVEMNIWLSFSQTDLGPIYVYIFSRFFVKFGT